MPDNHVDPSGNTEAFRAFTRDAPQEPAPSKLPMIVAVAVAVAIVLAVVVWLAF